MPPGQGKDYILKQFLQKITQATIPKSGEELYHAPIPYFHLQVIFDICENLCYRINNN